MANVPVVISGGREGRYSISLSLEKKEEEEVGAGRRRGRPVCVCACVYMARMSRVHIDAGEEER